MKKGYEFVYKVEVVAEPEVFTEKRTVIFPTQDFDVALRFGQELLDKAMKENGGANVWGVSLKLVAERGFIHE